VWCCLCDPTFSRFSRTPTCDRQTQTDRHRPMASTADAEHRAVKTVHVMCACKPARMFQWDMPLTPVPIMGSNVLNGYSTQEADDTNGIR